MDKWLHAQKSVEWSYLSIPKFQRLHRRGLGLKVIHVSKMGHSHMISQADTRIDIDTSLFSVNIYIK